MEQQPRPEAQRATSRKTAAPLSLRIGFWVCIGIAVAVVIRRLVALAHPSSSGPPQMAGLDAFFPSHSALTLAHIVPALLFVPLRPLFFSRRVVDPLWLRPLLFPPGSTLGIPA